MAASPLPRLRRICLALGGATEVEAWGTATFRCPRIFAMYAQPSDQKHSRGRPGVWLKAAPGNQQLMVRDRPDRFYVPPYVGVSGWVGVFLDGNVSWEEVALLVEDAWRLLAPKKLVKARDAAPPSAPGTATPKATARGATPQRKPKHASSASQAASTPRSARTASATRVAAKAKSPSRSKRSSSAATRRAR